MCLKESLHIKDLHLHIKDILYISYRQINETTYVSE